MSKRTSTTLTALLLMPLFAYGISDSGVGVEPQEIDPKEQHIVEIIDLSGLTGLSLQARNLAQQALNESQAPIGKQYEVVGAIAALWSPEKLQQQFKHILASYEDGDLDRLASTLRSHSFLQARQKEERAVAEQSSQSYLHYMQRLQSETISAGRMRYINELDAAMQFSAMLLQTREAVYAELTQNLTDWQPEDQWQQSLHNDVTGFLLYVHRDTSNEELHRLALAYQQPPLQSWLQQVGQVLQQKR